MVQLNELRAEIAHTETLIKTARGKRLYDLQTYRKRMLKELQTAERYLSESK